MDTRRYDRGRERSGTGVDLAGVKRIVVSVSERCTFALLRWMPEFCKRVQLFRFLIYWYSPYAAWVMTVSSPVVQNL